MPAVISDLPLCVQMAKTCRTPVWAFTRCMCGPIQTMTFWLASTPLRSCCSRRSMGLRQKLTPQAAASGVNGLGKGGRAGTEPLQVRWSLGNGGAAEDGEAVQPHDSSSHSSSGASHGDSASHMYLDLRPFMDQAPTTVRSGTSSMEIVLRD